ncbi:DNA-binding transcriptional ArsR family regulator [Streptacidiphilus sp. MAP12-20]|uniref:helix-turn-helix domain-containing protein n=1 Tax=Streptacidiphilus sp. MAP12-20 TaxID=3156299 RepID=UPI00351101CF
MDAVKDEGTEARVGVRMVDDVETLKALSDPLRLSILRLMMDGSAEPRAWTAKELAGGLGEPQTKLYRHLKHLEEVGLIKVAETRLVSGIVEQRYVGAQRHLELSRTFLASAPADEEGDTRRNAVIDMVGTATTSFLRDFDSAVRSGKVDVTATESARRPLMMVGDLRMPAERAAVFHERFRQLVDEVNAEPADPEGVPVHLLVALYSFDD